jgi:hypothetical protein
VRRGRGAEGVVLEDRERWLVQLPVRVLKLSPSRSRLVGHTDQE